MTDYSRPFRPLGVSPRSFAAHPANGVEPMSRGFAPGDAAITSVPNSSTGTGPLPAARAGRTPCPACRALGDCPACHCDCHVIAGLPEWVQAAQDSYEWDLGWEHA